MKAEMLPSECDYQLPGRIFWSESLNLPKVVLNTTYICFADMEECEDKNGGPDGTTRLNLRAEKGEVRVQWTYHCNDWDHPHVDDPQGKGWYDPIPYYGNHWNLAQSVEDKIEHWQKFQSFHVTGSSEVDAAMKAMEIIVESEAQSNRQALEHLFTEPSPWG
jgi:hypothetical protein